jgi:hypothetical protein
MGFLSLTACTGPQVQDREIQVSVYVDGQIVDVQAPSGSTAGEVLEAGGIQVDILDKSDPPLYTLMNDGDDLRLIRVVEEFDITESVIPYETQVLRNESLPEGERRLIQPGANGVLETTFRRVYEDGLEVASSIVKTVVIEQPVPEVVMVGSQAPYAAIPIQGRLAYISAGNAWIMEETTGTRRPVVTSGDLDGYIFDLSPDGIWLLYTRSDPDEDTINSLWVAKVDDASGQVIDLGVDNVIHYAAWVPDSTNGVVFSTVETSLTAPGWQANNDLLFLNFSSNGWVSRPRTAIQPSSGGLYGWWGTTFSYSPDGEEMIYTRPDGIGRVDFENEELVSIFSVVALQTLSDWAWVPGVEWAPDGTYLYVVDHVPQEGVASVEESQVFSLMALPMVFGVPVTLVEDVGMFASPSVSPKYETEFGEESYRIAYLQALIPTQSFSSGYRLVVMDRDGSNQQVLFPGEGVQGLDPQRLEWVPVGEGMDALSIGLIYQGDLWLVNVGNGQAQQLTGDGLTISLDWE